MIGTGYVGLVSGACIADFGHEVTCVDKDGTKISALNSGEIPIYEPGLKDIVQSNVRSGQLQFTTALSEALKGANAAFIAVGTPSRRGDGHADLSYVYEAAREIAAALTEFTVIITKSTVPVGTGDGLDKRIGSKFLHAGPGFGGSCFPKDVRALIKTAQDYEVPMRILEAAEAVNDRRKRAMARKVSSAFAGILRGKTVAVLGLTFKPNTDDMREAPSIPLITALQDMGAKVRVYDPVGMEQAKQVLADVTYYQGPYDCVEEADAAVIVTEWEQFRALDLERLRDLMACPVIVDLRNIYCPEAMKKHGFAYVSIGRAPTFQPASVSIPGLSRSLSRTNAVAPRARAVARVNCGD